MNQKELLMLSIGVFLTIIAWMIVDIFQVRSKIISDKEIKSIGTIRFVVDENVLNSLKDRQ